MRRTKQQLDEIVKLVNILRCPFIPEEEKMVAENKLQSIKDEITASDYNIPKDRISDVQQLEKVVNDPKMTEFHRTKAKLAIKKIVSEGKDIRDMRKALIKEMKYGRVDNMKDIREIVGKHSKYQ